MDQPTFADLEYQGKRRKTRRELFLERMDGLIPWQNLEARICPFYPKTGRGRHPYPLSAMLRVRLRRLERGIISYYALRPGQGPPPTSTGVFGVD